MVQLLVSGVLLVVAIAVKLLMPDVLDRYRARVLDLLGADTDFVEVFSAAGRAFSEEGAIGGALTDAYTAVFGSEEVTASPSPTSAVCTPEAQPADAELLQQVLGFAYTAPVEGQLSSGFGLRTDPLEGVSRFHYGLDIAAPEGAVVSSFADGEQRAGPLRRRRPRQRLFHAVRPLHPRHRLRRTAGVAGRSHRRGGRYRPRHRSSPPL